MSDLKQYQKRRKQLAAEIKKTKAMLASQKQALRNLREAYQHEAIDHLDDYLEASSPERFSIVRLVKQWLRK